MKRETWVVVANSAEARIFKVENNALKNEFTELVHPESRLAERDLVSSKPGRAFDSMGRSRHSMEPQTTQKEQELNAFAKQTAAYINEAVTQNKLARFHIAANPTFLGLLRQHLSAPSLKLLGAEISKDLIKQTPVQIREYLPPVL